MDDNDIGIPDFTKAFSPRKQFKLSRAMYQELLKRVEALEAKAPKKEPEAPKRKRRTKEEMEAERAETK